MISSNENRPDKKPNPLATVIVYGRAGGVGLPQASWFKEEDREAASAAAKPLGLSVLELRTDAEKALALDLHEGVLKGSGRVIIGSVTPEIFKRIEDHARNLPKAAPPSRAVESSVGQVNSVGGGNVPVPIADNTPPASPAKTAPPNAIAPWEALRAGSVVLAAYWTEKNEIEGWWPAVVTRVDDKGFNLKWRDTNEYDLGKVTPKYIAILHPDLLASGE